MCRRDEQSEPEGEAAGPCKELHDEREWAHGREDRVLPLVRPREARQVAHHDEDATVDPEREAVEPEWPPREHHGEQDVRRRQHDDDDAEDEDRPVHPPTASFASFDWSDWFDWSGGPPDSAPSGRAHTKGDASSAHEMGSRRRRRGPRSRRAAGGLRMPTAAARPPMTHHPAVTKIAMRKPCARGAACRYAPPESPAIAGMIATATRPPTLATSLLSAEARPECSSLTAPRAVAVSGATVTPR